MGQVETLPVLARSGWGGWNKMQTIVLFELARGIVGMLEYWSNIEMTINGIYLGHVTSRFRLL